MTKSILFAWELGAHFGHLSRQVLIARELRHYGCELLFAVRDTEIASKLLSRDGFAFVQAPIFIGRVRLERPPASYAELLLADGFADRLALHGRVCAWIKLFELHRPELIVVDHSPTALVAARATGIRAVQIGSGFEIPPSADPMPSFGLYDVAKTDFRRSERLVVHNINSVLLTCNAASKKLGSLAELFDIHGKILATFAELDPYSARPASEYVGPLVTSDSGVALAWSTINKPKIFAYFHAGVTGTSAMVEAFRRCGAETICVIPEISAATAQRESTDKLRIHSQIAQLQPLLREADLVVSNGSSGLTAQALLAGVPSLMLPATVEQLMHARCVRKLGAGLIAGKRRETEVFVAAIGELLNSSSWRTRAKAFARKYEGFNPAKAIASVANSLVGESSRIEKRTHETNHC